MKVSNLGSTKGVADSKRRKKAAGVDGTFADRLKETVAAREASGTAEAGAVGAVGSILAVQEVPDAMEGRSRGLVRRYGDEVLDRLDEIRHGLLMGAISKERLAVLARTLRQKRQESDDPRLKEIIDEIELRAEVEIAKLTRDA